MRNFKEAWVTIGNLWYPWLSLENPWAIFGKGMSICEDSCLSTCLVDQIMTKWGFSTYEVIKIMMYDAGHQKKGKLPYN